ncbi:hyaluronidase-1-like isoform X1 [Oculina patagonica]
MSYVQGPFTTLLARLLQLHLLVAGISLLVNALDIKNSFCKCEDFPAIEDRPFVAIWNAPTGGCYVNYSININLRDFDILENPKQTWDGKYVTVFYNAQLGLYPYFTNEQGTNSYNGGMPQLVNLAAHLKKMKQDIIKKIPDPDFNGLAIIDWEGWRPTWGRNFDSKRIYQSRSVELVQGKHPEWSMEEVIKEAKKEFEQSARVFMESSIKLARQLRPKGLWGFYGFPDCFGTSETNYRCSHEHQELNNKLKWLFSSSMALYPSVYMYDQQAWNKAYAYGRLEEAFRLATLVSKEKEQRIPVFPYFRHLYEGKPLEFAYLTDVDLHNTIGQAADMGAAGVVMWGNRRDENTSPDVCRELNEYIRTKLGPYFESLRRQLETCSEKKCNGRGRCVDSQLISSRWTSEEPNLYRPKCKGSPRMFSTDIRQHSTIHKQHDDEAKNHHKLDQNDKKDSKPSVANRTHHKHGLSSKQRNYLIKELELLNATGNKMGMILNSRHRNSSKDFVFFMSTSDSAVEVNKAPQEQKSTDRGVVATSGLHYHDQYNDSPSFTQTAVKGELEPNKLNLHCNESSPETTNCEIIKESNTAYTTGFHFPHTYVVFICVSLGSALLVSSAFIVSYYYCSIRKRVEEDIPRGDYE